MSRTKKIAIIILGVVCVTAIALGTAFYMVMYPSAPTLIDGPLHVACVGDSITYGAGIKGRTDNSYPAQLQKLLGESYQVLNYGLSGRSLQTDVIMSYSKEKFYEISQESEPAIVIIMLGTNDTVPLNWDASRYERDLEEFVNTYKSLGSAPTVYLMKCPPIYNEMVPGKQSSHNPSVLENEVLPIIERVAKKTGVETIDVFTALSNRENLFPDGLHPNAEGAGIIAETVCEKIV